MSKMPFRFLIAAAFLIATPLFSVTAEAQSGSKGSSSRSTTSRSSTRGFGSRNTTSQSSTRGSGTTGSGTKSTSGKTMTDKTRMADKEAMAKKKMMADKEAMAKKEMMSDKEGMAKKEMMADKMMTKTVGLEGHCPVCVIDMKKWMKGSPDHQTTFDGVTYYFPGDGPKQKFMASPEKYVPALNGDCIACYASAKKRVPGNVRYASLFRGRLYLFPSDKEKQVFMKEPQKFENTDLALEGHCAVCKTMASKEVQGNSRFTAIHNGFRYLFPSESERQAFIKEPAKFADKSLDMGMQEKTVMRDK